jgi:NADPH-dependent ferric siderophore reductase
VENAQRRITLISHDPRTPDRDWDHSAAAPTRVVILDSLIVLRHAIASGLVDLDLDVERLVLDRNASPAEFLALLEELPHQFTGDVLLIGRDETGFVSTATGGKGRELRAIDAVDVRSYLELHRAVTGRIAIARNAHAERDREAAAA